MFDFLDSRVDSFLSVLLGISNTGCQGSLRDSSNHCISNIILTLKFSTFSNRFRVKLINSLLSSIYSLTCFVNLFFLFIISGDKIVNLSLNILKCSLNNRLVGDVSISYLNAVVIIESYSEQAKIITIDVGIVNFIYTILGKHLIDIVLGKRYQLS